MEGTFKHRLANLVGAGAALTAFSLAMPAIAQDEPEAGPADIATSEAEKTQIADIIVTARKREERLQDVPVTATVVSGDALIDAGIHNFEDFDVPAVKIVRQGMSDTLNIRGVSSGSNLGFEQSVPVYVDGMYFGRARVQRLAFLDLDRIEILKGPQPTYLGKNAIGGAVNITTKAPSGQFGGEIGGSYEFALDQYQLSGALGGPIAPGLNARVAASHLETKGYTRNSVTGEREPQEESTVARLALAFQPIDAFTLTARGFYASDKQIGRANEMVRCTSQYLTDYAAAGEDCGYNRVQASFGSIPTAGQSRYLYDGGGASFFNDVELYGGTIDFEYGFAGDYTLNLLFGAYDLFNRNYNDTDSGAVNYGNSTLTEDFWQYSTELRLQSPSGQTVDWLAGLYYDRNRNDLQAAFFSDSSQINVGSPRRNAPNLTSTNLTFFSEEVNSWAIFGEADIRIADPLTLKVGARYEEVNKDGGGNTCLGNLYSVACRAGTVTTRLGSVRDKRFQPAVTLEARPRDDFMIYGSWKRGFKAGGFDAALSVADFIFESEKAEAFELGVKATFFDRLVLNVSAYRNKIRDLQVSTLPPNSTFLIVRNAGSAISQGFEYELRFAATNRLTLVATGSYLDAYYGSYGNAPCWDGQTAAEGCVAGNQNLTNAKLNYAPKWSGTLAANYRAPISDTLTLNAGADMFYTSSFLTLADNNPFSRQEGFGKFNARLGVESDQGWEIALAARNLTDVETSSFRGTVRRSSGAVIAFTDPPATYEVQLKYRF